MYNSLLFAVSLFLPISHMHTRTHTPTHIYTLSFFFPFFTLLSHSKLSSHPTFFARKISIYSFIVYYSLCLLNFNLFTYLFVYSYFIYLLFFFSALTFTLPRLCPLTVFCFFGLLEICIVNSKRARGTSFAI